MNKIINYNSNLRYEEFRKELVNGIADICGEEFTVREEHVHKNNAKELFGVSIRNKNTNVAPTIYLEGFYEDFINGEKNLNEIENDVIRIYKLNCLNGNRINVDFFKDFSIVKEKLVYRLVNYDMNRERLKEIPHRRYLDLAIIYVLNLNECGGSITIRNEHLDIWNVDEETVYQYAEKNTPKAFKLKISRFSDMMLDILKDKEDVEPEDLDTLLDNHMLPMFIMTNEQCMFGASSLLYKDSLKEFAEKIGSGFYLLPSSVHETILLPEDEKLNSENLEEMVRSVNETVVDKEVFLSDNVYYYSPENNKLEIAG